MEAHLATIWEAVADAVPTRAAIVQGERRVSWRDFDDRAARLAAALESLGHSHGSKVALYLYNCPEYLEAQYAAFKIGAVPVNVNYRYLDDELAYILENSDSESIVFHSSLGDRVRRVHERVPKLRALIEVDDGGEPNTGTVPYEATLAAHDRAPRRTRDPGDIFILYTGGTTGMPKGVMRTMGDHIVSWSDEYPINGADDIIGVVRALERSERLATAVVPCPLMHGTGMLIGFIVHAFGGTIVLPQSRGLDADAVWAATEREAATHLVIVGDAFGRPLLRALASGRAYVLERLSSLVSSGAMLSAEVREGLLELVPHLTIRDLLGSSEGGMGETVSTTAGAGPTAKFALSRSVKVFTDDDQEVEPGSGETGMLATSSNVPLGYYKDPEKSARTFREIDGVRYSFPGDWATVESDGSIALLGRGSNCINTGGEKVFPEEVEEAIKRHPAIDDCLVFGIEDERFGQRVVGVASRCPGGEASGAQVVADIRDRLAHYKLPKQLVIVDHVPRAPNGKADYPRARELFAAT